MRKATLAVFLTLTGPLAAQEVTILAMGDSLTAGYGLPQGDGFVPQLETWLRDRGHNVAVVNAGVSGDTTAGGLARIDWALGPDVDAMILALGANDMLRGLPPAQAESNLGGILETAGGAAIPVLISGVDAPLNYGAAYKAEFDAIFPTLAAEYDALLFPDFLTGLRTAFEDGIARDELLQPDGLHPTALGIAHMVEGIGPSVEELITRIQ